MYKTLLLTILFAIILTHAIIANERYSEYKFARVIVTSIKEVNADGLAGRFYYRFYYYNETKNHYDTLIFKFRAYDSKGNSACFYYEVDDGLLPEASADHKMELKFSPKNIDCEWVKYTRLVK